MYLPRRRNKLHTADAGGLEHFQCVMVCVLDCGETPYLYLLLLLLVLFVLCVGSHMKHNEAEGDNVGPLLVKKE